MKKIADNMFTKYILSIFVLLCTLIEDSSQLLPYYGASNYFYVNQFNAVTGAGSITITIPTTFPISTAPHRVPFYAYMAASYMKTQLHQNFYFWTDMPSYTSTSFTLSIYFRVVTVGAVVTNFGFEPGSYLRFRYLLVLNTFPNKFVSIGRVYGGLSTSIAANSFT